MEVGIVESLTVFFGLLSMETGRRLSELKFEGQTAINPGI